MHGRSSDRSEVVGSGDECDESEVEVIKISGYKKM